MTGFDWLMPFAIVAVSFASALAALLLFGAVRNRRRPPRGTRATGICVFLFEGGELTDATAPARALLATGPEGLADWQRLCAALAPRFGDVAARLGALDADGRVEIAAEGGDNARVTGRSREGITRIAVEEGAGAPEEIALEGPVYHALGQELATLRSVAEHLPAPAWVLDGNGEISWSNRKYVDLVQRAKGMQRPPAWPLPALFSHEAGARPGRRVSIPVAGGSEPLWFDLAHSGEDAGRVNFALPADSAVGAETALRNFVQTLTKTFAHLPIGLAIFDRQRHLALFNPALTDLTTLGPDFLSARPTLVAFLDRLRERQMMPEPRDYKTWRQAMTELEEAAERGTFEETWSIRTGQTYRVTGRPQPDGAVAFLFEDISAEIAMTRRYRSELEIGQEVLDSLHEAIAVFSPAGVLTLSNSAYARLWDSDPGSTLGEIGVAEAKDRWQARCQPSPVWDEVAQRIGEVGARSTLQREVVTSDGTPLDIRAAPLTGGATLVGFSQRAPAGQDAGALTAAR